MSERSTADKGLNQEFYQIGTSILTSFNKYRPPLDIFRFKEDVGRVVPFYKVGGRLSNEQIEELHTLAADGTAFVSRDDHPVYVKHISYQLDLVLVDQNLQEKEIADICTQALTRRIDELIEQPVKNVFDLFWKDLMVLTEYLYADMKRSRAFVRRLHKEHTLANHSVNCGFVGLALFGKMKEKDFASGDIKRQMFDRLAAGFFLHDIGMAKIPAFIRQKNKPLTADERTKVNAHSQAGLQMITKADLKFPEIEACILEHHERLNGSGYPQKKKDISVIGRLCGFVDSLCAMTTKRPYAEAIPIMKAAAQLGQDKKYDGSFALTFQAMCIQDLNMKP